LGVLVGFFFLHRDSDSFTQHQAMITYILIPFSPYLPRQKIDHGTMVFPCRSCLIVVGCGVTVVYDPGVLSALNHGTLPTVVTKIINVFC